MRLLIIFCFLTISPLGFADEMSEPGEIEIPSRYHSQALDTTEKLAAYNWIKAAKCEYHTPMGADSPDPEIAKIKNPNCNGKDSKGMSSVCTGEIICETATMKIWIGEVFCKSLGPKRCPDARSCALSSDISRAQHSDGVAGKPIVFFGQKFRGWGLSDRETDKEDNDDTAGEDE